MRGHRRRKPTKLKIVQGTFRSDRARGNEPRPQPIAPACPSGLHPIAKDFWNRLAPRLEQMGLLTEIDGHMFALLCGAVARFDMAHERFLVVLQKSVKNPAKHLKMIRLAELSVERGEQSARLIGAHFGLSPASRASLDVTPSGAAEDDFEKFLEP